jgi:hypothetical protein
MRVAQWLSVPSASLFLACSMASFGQTQIQRILLNPQSTVPSRLLVKRGTILEFYGDLADGDAVLPTSFSIRAGTQVRANGTFKKSWSLRWDPSKEPTSTSYAMVFRADAGQQESRIARIGVTLVDSAPFHLASPKDLQDVTGVVPVQVTAAGSVKIGGGEVFVDGTSRGAKIDSQGKGSVNLLGLTPGLHTLVVRVAAEGGGDFETEAAKVKLVSDVALQRSEVGPVDLRNSAPHVPLKVAIPGEMKAKSADFFLDGKAFAHSDTPPFAEVSLNPAGLGTGAHSLYVEVTTEDGEKHVSTTIPLDIIGNPQADFEAWIVKLERMIEVGQPVRADYQGALERWKADRTAVGDLNVAVKKLRVVDLNLEYALTKLELPASISADDKVGLSSALGEMRAGYSRLVHEEEALLRAIAANEDYLVSLGNMNTALLKIGSANDRIQQVAEHLGNAQQGRQELANALAYPMTGNLRNDYPAMVQKLDAVIQEAEAVRGLYDDTTASSQNILALNKAISQDTWVSNNITKLAIPKALSPAQRNAIVNVLQGVSSAYRYRGDAERILKRRLASALGVSTSEGGLSSNVRVSPESQSALFNKAQLTLSQAKDQLRTLSRQLGFGD